MFDLKNGLGTLVNLASELGGKDLDLNKIITDQFINENTNLATVKELLGKVGIDSFDDIQAKIPQLDSIIKQFSSFGSWQEFVAKAAKAYLANK